MECPICKKNYDDEFNFCPWCGSEKPEISYDEAVEKFEKENKTFEEETIQFEKEFRDIGKELELLQEDIQNFEKWERDNNEELKVLYLDVFDQEIDDSDSKLELEKSSSVIRCPNCGSTKFLSDYDRGEVVCTRCGLLVNEHLLDMGRPWLYTNEKNSREHLKFY